jgi:hypothetical protein
MSREAIDALEAWHATSRALREATPGTAQWVRLRMIAKEQHAAYESLIDRDSDEGHSDRARTQPAHAPGDVRVG